VCPNWLDVVYVLSNSDLAFDFASLAKWIVRPKPFAQLTPGVIIAATSR